MWSVVLIDKAGALVEVLVKVEPLLTGATAFAAAYGAGPRGVAVVIRAADLPLLVGVPDCDRSSVTVPAGVTGRSAAGDGGRRARVFLIELEVEGKRQFYRESLPARAAVVAARKLALDGFNPRVIMLRIGKQEAEVLGHKRYRRDYAAEVTSVDAATGSRSRN